MNYHVQKVKRECIVWSIAFLSSGTVVTSDSFGRVQFWDWERGTLLESHTVSTSAVLSLSVSEVGGCPPSPPPGSWGPSGFLCAGPEALRQELPGSLPLGRQGQGWEGGCWSLSALRCCPLVLPSLRLQTPALFLSPEGGQHHRGHLDWGHLPVSAVAGEDGQPGEALGADKALSASHPRCASRGTQLDSSHLRG